MVLATPPEARSVWRFDQPPGDLRDRKASSEGVSKVGGIEPALREQAKAK